MSRVLLDIGAHVGETLAVAMEPRWRFDRIVCFEPAPACWPDLERLADDRVEICRFGLWSSDATLPLYQPGAVGASVHGSKGGSADAVDAVDAEFRDAAAWFAANVDVSDEVIMKVNCEGAESELLVRLAESGEIDKVGHLMVHWDVRKVPGMEQLESSTKALLSGHTVTMVDSDLVMVGGNVTDKTRNWLRWYHGRSVTRYYIEGPLAWGWSVRRAVYRIRH